MAHAPSPQMNRLDRILELVTDHEANYREQVPKGWLESTLQHLAPAATQQPQVLAAVVQV